MYDQETKGIKIFTNIAPVTYIIYNFIISSFIALTLIIITFFFTKRWCIIIYKLILTFFVKETSKVVTPLLDTYMYVNVFI